MCLPRSTRLEGIYKDTLGNHHVEIISRAGGGYRPAGSPLASGRTVTARIILIATGASPDIPDVPGSEFGITSNEAFHLEAVPRRIVIAGAGYIANEFAGIFHQFGAQVTLVNRTDVILRGYDEQIRDRLLQIAMVKGINFRFQAQFSGIEKLEDGSLLIHLSRGDPIATDVLMFATGRKPEHARSWSGDSWCGPE